MPNLFAYLNYRHYLRDVYQERKAANPHYSYRIFNEAAGIKSPVFLKNIIDGKRNLTKRMTDAVLKALKLGKTEAGFFRTLVTFTQSKSAEERTKAFRQMTFYKEYQAVKGIEAHQYAFYDAWYHVAILEMTKLVDFREDPNWIAQKLFPPISPAQAKESLALLKTLGLVAPDRRNRLRMTEKTLSTPEEVFDISVLRFHSEMIRHAERNLTNTEGEFRDVSSLTIALDDAGFTEAKRRIQELRRELNVLLSNTNSPDRVYQINFQLFNLTTIKPPGGTK